MCILLVLTTLLAADSVPQTTPPILPRATAFEIPLEAGGIWGEDDRTADHATVAINSERDILVAYHSTRDDITDTDGPTYGFHEPLKQVEIAFFEYDDQADEWNLMAQELLGSTIHDPLDSVEQVNVRCERPDVIAVGARFFVVWTRRYDRDQPDFEWEPAILECAWVEWNSSTSILEIHNNSLGDGVGYPLDADYDVRECAGVPDAVFLEVGSTSSTVGVLYPHQTDLGDVDEVNFDPPGDNDRLCDLRIVVTSISHSTDQLSITDEATMLISGIKFDGATAPPGQSSAGLILPDCARGQIDPITGAYRFWLAYEEQNLPTYPSTIPDGRIKLGLWEQTATGGWGSLVTVNIGSAGNPFVRRRPNLSSYPEGTEGEFVSLAFGRTNSYNDNDVVHDEWGFDPEAGLSKVARPVGHEFENTSDNHNRPILLHGTNDPLVRLLFVDHDDGAISQILEYDIEADEEEVRCGSDLSLGRPAVAYLQVPGSEPDEVILTWEERGEGLTYDRIWIRTR